MSDEEQQEVSGAYGPFANEVREKCEAQYGGMSQFSDPAGRRKAPIDTRVALPDLLHATPPARQASAVEQHQDCMSAMAGVRWCHFRGAPGAASRRRLSWGQQKL